MNITPISSPATGHLRDLLQSLTDGDPEQARLAITSLMAGESTPDVDLAIELFRKQRLEIKTTVPF